MAPVVAPSYLFFLTIIVLNFLQAIPKETAADQLRFTCVIALIIACRTATCVCTDVDCKCSVIALAHTIFDSTVVRAGQLDDFFYGDEILPLLNRWGCVSRSTVTVCRLLLLFLLLRLLLLLRPPPLLLLQRLKHRLLLLVWVHLGRDEVRVALVEKRKYVIALHFSALVEHSDYAVHL